MTYKDFHEIWCRFHATGDYHKYIFLSFLHSVIQIWRKQTFMMYDNTITRYLHMRISNLTQPNLFTTDIQECISSK